MATRATSFGGVWAEPVVLPDAVMGEFPELDLPMRPRYPAMEAAGAGGAAGEVGRLEQPHVCVRNRLHRCRWSPGRSSEWPPRRPALVGGGRYERFSDGRFRDGTRLLRRRPDEAPALRTDAPPEAPAAAAPDRRAG